VSNQPYVPEEQYKYWWVCFGRTTPKRILVEKASWGTNAWLLPGPAGLGDEKVVASPGQELFETAEEAIKQELKRLKKKERHFKDRIKALGRQVRPKSQVA